MNETRCDNDMLTKTCPRCGAQLFEDMDMCFECLYSFGCEDTWCKEWHEEEVPEGVYAEEVAVPGAWTLSMSSDVVDASVLVPPEGLVVGRGESCDVVLHARSVSRRHVRVSTDGERLWVEDLGARNAAMVCGHRLEGRACMQEGDVLDVCGVTFVARRR